MMNKPFARLLLIPIGLMLISFRAYDALNPKPDDTTPPNAYSGQAVMPQASHLKLTDLRGRMGQNPTLSDADVDWLLQTRKGGSLTKPYAASIARARPLEVLLQAHLTPAQKEKVFWAVVPDLQSRDRWGAVPDRLRACDALETFHDRRAIPPLQPLLSYPNARVQARAKRALRSLGITP